MSSTSRISLLLLAAMAAFSCGDASNTSLADGGAEPGGDASKADAEILEVDRCLGKGLPDTLSVTVDGLTRTAQVVHPVEAHDKPLPVVINMHGFTMTSQAQREASEMDAHAREAGYIAVYPQGTGSVPGWNAGACCGEAAANGRDDVATIAALIDELAKESCIDEERIYAVGYSNGGFMAHRLACELSDRIAGVASVAGMMGIGECEPARPIPVMQIHGTSDLVVPFGGNVALGFISADDTVDGWVERFHCLDGEPEVVFDEGDSRCVRYSDCDAPIEYCVVSGGGHTWPGGSVSAAAGKTSRDLNANEAMWEFFEGE